MDGEVISEISDEQISFRKKRKNPNKKENTIYIPPPTVQKDFLVNKDSKDNNDNNNKKENKINSIGLFNNIITKETKEIKGPKETKKPKQKKEVKEENKKSESDSEYSSLDIQKAGFNSYNTRMLGGNKHSIVDLKNSSKYNSLSKKIIINNNSKSQSSLDKNSNSENSYKKIDLDGLLNLKENTILGVNLLHEKDVSITKNKKQFESSSITGSIQMYFDSNKRKKFQIKLNKAKKLIKKNQESFVNNIIEAIKDDKIDFIQDLMLSETNKIVYKKILKKDTFINMMLINKRMKMLLMVLNDDYYQFNPLFPFEYIASKLKTRDKDIFKSEELCQFILNVIEYGLYEKKLTKVIGWFLLCFELKQEFIHFISINNDYYNAEKQIYEEGDYELINEYRRNNNNFNGVLILCLEHGLEDLAIELVNVEGQLENGQVIRTAIKNRNKDFLKFIWEAPILSLQKCKDNKNKKEINNNNKNDTVENECKYFNNGMKVINISSLIEAKKNKFSLSKDLISEMISTWKFLDMDNDLFASLFKCGLYDEINILIYRYPNHKNWYFTQQNFKTIIRDKVVNLILPCLKVDECKEILRDDEIQKNIVSNYLTKGHIMYYGAEMLNNIPITYFNYSLSNDFIDNIIVAIKNKVIINCHSPVLTCLILFEIISNISQISTRFSFKCNKVSYKLMEICKNIDESNPNEKYIKFLLSQKDSKGRSAYEIAANTPGCTILESTKLGTIVDNMWQGRLRFDGIFDFSSLLKFIESPKEKGSNPFQVFSSLDANKTYFHQIALWKESCSLRFYQESLTTILLIVLYNLYLYFLVNYNEIMCNFDELTKREQILLVIYISWCCIIVLNIPLQIIYCRLSGKRKFSLDFWNCIEISLAISSFLTLIDTQKLLPSHDEFGNIVPSNGKNDAAFILKATILSVNDIFVWLRITGILLTYKEFGPLIRMIYLLSIITTKYLVIYLIIFIACATIYTTLFYKASVMYQSYSTTFTTLFQGYLNNSKYQYFDYYKKFGAILCIIFVIFGGLILVNMLIILLSNEYEKLSNVVSASHRSVLIRYYKRNKWDKKFGYIILLATPINFISFIIIPIHLFLYGKTKTKKNNEYKYLFNNENNMKNNLNNLPNNSKIDNRILSINEENENNENKENNENNKKEDNKTEIKEEELFNSTVSAIYYILFYFPIIFIIEAACSIFFIPFSYLAGIICSISISNKTTLNDYLYQLLIFLLWVLLGVPVSIYRYFIDLYYLSTTIFSNFDKQIINEKKRIMESITTKEVKEFIQFIHKRDIKEKNDLYTLFRSFLLWENDKEENKNIKSNSDYLSKVSKIGETKIKNISVILIGLNSKNAKTKTSFHFFNKRIYKRNIIIFEILQNFLIDNEFFLVDIEKMKMILPNTVYINNDYIKRLKYTNISNIQRALNKKKKKKNAFMENKLLNKMVGAVIRLNKVFDGENVDPLQNEEERKKNKFDLEENEDDFYTVYNTILTNMTNELKQTIMKMQMKTKENEIKNKARKKSLALVKGSDYTLFKDLNKNN